MAYTYPGKGSWGMSNARGDLDGSSANGDRPRRRFIRGAVAAVAGGVVAARSDPVWAAPAESDYVVLKPSASTRNIIEAQASNVIPLQLKVAQGREGSLSDSWLVLQDYDGTDAMRLVNIGYLGTLAPVIAMKGSGGGWAFGVDVYGASFFLGKDDWPREGDVRDVFFVNHNGDGPTNVPTVGIGSAGDENYQLLIKPQLENSALGALCISQDNPPVFTGRAIKVKDYSNVEKFAVAMDGSVYAARLVGSAASPGRIATRDTAIDINRTSRYDPALTTKSAGDTEDRLRIRADGVICFGDGTAPVSTRLSHGNSVLYLSAGDLSIYTAGKGLKVKEGADATMGRATLVNGTVVVNTTTVTASSEIFLTCQTPGGTPGFLRVSARTAGKSFTIRSSSAADASEVAWFIVEPA
jgi:hypothetical protein